MPLGDYDILTVYQLLLKNLFFQTTQVHFTIFNFHFLENDSLNNTVNFNLAKVAHKGLEYEVILVMQLKTYLKKFPLVLKMISSPYQAHSRVVYIFCFVSYITIATSQLLT